MIQKLAIKTVTPIAAALFLFTVLFTASSNAETWVRCDACSFSQSEALAIAVGPEQDVVIFSASNNTAQAYWTRTEVSGAGCEPLRPGQNRTQKGVFPKSQNAISAGQCSYTTVAQSVPLDVSKEQLLDAFHGAYVETNGTMQKNAQVNIADTVLYVGTFNYQSNQDVNNFLRNAALNGVLIVDHHIGGNSATCHSEIKENGEVIVTCQPS